ncbi:hypothetical protein KAI87_02540 [Myxococcota bacterium]|nr:hypothetical protein [Myxococcota bacterium]
MAGGVFGDSSLTNIMLSPSGEDERRVYPGALRTLGILALLSPVVYQAAATTSVGIYAFPLGFIALTFFVFSFWTLSHSVFRYGVGPLVLSRAALGVRGSLLFTILLFLIQLGWIVYFTVWASQWGGRALWLLNSLFPAEAKAFISISTWQPALRALMAILIIIGALGLSNIREAGMFRRAGTMIGFVFIVILSMLVLAGSRSRGFLGYQKVPDFDLLHFIVILAGLIGATFYPLLASLEFVRQIQKPDKKHPLSQYFRMIFVGGLLSLVIWSGFSFLAAVAAKAVRVYSEMHPISDAAAFGGMPGLGGGILLTLFVAILGVGVLGITPAVVSFSALAPDRMTHSTARVAVVLLLSILAPLAAFFLPTWLDSIVWWVVGGSAILLSVLAADIVFVRRGKLLLEELYLLRSIYGGRLGVRLSGFFALFAGFAFLSLIFFDAFMFFDFFSPDPNQEKLIKALTPLIAGPLSGVIYVLVAPVDFLFAGVGRGINKIKGRLPFGDDEVTKSESYMVPDSVELSSHDFERPLLLEDTSDLDFMVDEKTPEPDGVD